MKVIRRRLDSVQLVPPNIRFFEGNIEITFDGGATWVISPENDPRYGVQFLAPALTGEDAKCDAAYRMTEIIRAQVDAALDAANAVGLATTIIGILTVLIPINPIVALVTALAAALLVIGAIVLDEAFDEDRYDAIQCIFYRNIGEDGQVSAAQLEQILIDFETEFAGSIAADVCVSVVFVMGQNGLSNAGSLTGGAGDCDDCFEMCPFWDFTDNAVGWDAMPGDPFSFLRDSGGIYGTYDFFGDYAMSACTALTVPTGCTITGFYCTISGEMGYAPDGHTEVWVGTDRSEGLAATQHDYSQLLSSGLHTWTRTIVGSGQNVLFALGSIDNGTSARWVSAGITWTGDKPLFTGGTECP